MTSTGRRRKRERILALAFSPTPQHLGEKRKGGENN